ncbi:MAG: BLUF domain-containing protein [Alphaproteobacteria bacterium]|nr:BLUF domain-containing protein [Alphaproteobacteria bacterium]
MQRRIKAMHLFTISYYSKSRLLFLGKKLTKEIRLILDSCNRNNPLANITGTMIFNDHYFVQIMEGDRTLVSTMFSRIIQDPRHSDVVILNAGTIKERSFRDWSAAFAGHSEVIDQIYLKYSPIIGFLPQRMEAESLTMLMIDLSKSEARIAHSAITAPPRIVVHSQSESMNPPR